MSDLIDRQAALHCFHDWIDKHGDVHTADEMPEYRAIEALPSAQPDLQPTCNQLATDCISRRAALALAKDIIVPIKDGTVYRHRCIDPQQIMDLPPEQPEQNDTSEFWRKRADFYSDMCMNLIGEMGRGVKIESVKINENGIEFIKKQPPAQSIDLQELEDRFGEYVRFVVNDMLTGEGKRWTR